MKRCMVVVLGVLLIGVLAMVIYLVSSIYTIEFLLSAANSRDNNSYLSSPWCDIISEENFSQLQYLPDKYYDNNISVYYAKGCATIISIDDLDELTVKRTIDTTIIYQNDDEDCIQIDYYFLMRFESGHWTVVTISKDVVNITSRKDLGTYIG